MPFVSPSSTILGSTIIRRSSLRGGFIEHTDEQGVNAHRLTRPCGAGNEHVGQLGQSPRYSCRRCPCPRRRPHWTCAGGKPGNPAPPECTGMTTLLGTSMPTTEIFPGTGAIRTLETPSARATSSERLVSLFSRTPCSSATSYRVTEGPCTAPVTWPSMPKELSTLDSRSRVPSSSSWAARALSPLGWVSRSREG